MSLFIDPAFCIDMVVFTLFINVFSYSTIVYFLSISLHLEHLLLLCHCLLSMWSMLLWYVIVFCQCCQYCLCVMCVCSPLFLPETKSTLWVQIKLPYLTLPYLTRRHMQTHTNTHADTRKHACRHTCRHTHTHMTYACMHARMHVRTRTDTHMRTH